MQEDVITVRLRRAGLWGLGPRGTGGGAEGGQGGGSGVRLQEKGDREAAGHGGQAGEGGHGEVGGAGGGGERRAGREELGGGAHHGLCPLATPCLPWSGRLLRPAAGPHVEQSELRPFQRTAATLRRWQKEVLNYWRYPITNAPPVAGRATTHPKTEKKGPPPPRRQSARPS